MSELNPNDLDVVGAIALDEKGQPSKVEGKHGHAVDSGGEGGRRPMSNGTKLVGVARRRGSFGSGSVRQIVVRRGRGRKG